MQTEARTPVSQSDLKKIEKIMELMKGATSAGEAEAASAALTRTLLRIGIDRAEAEQRLGSIVRPSPFVLKTLETGASDWRKRLASTCVDVMMCSCVYGGSYSNNWTGYRSRYSYNRVEIVGREADVDAAIDLYTRIAKEVERLADAAWKSVDHESLWYVGVKQWKNSYRLGLISGIAYRLREATKQELEDHGGSALVLVRKEEADEELRRMFPNTKRTSTKGSRIHGAAFSRGKQDARLASLRSELRA